MTFSEQVQRAKNHTKNIILLGYGGSHAYGTNIAGSDIDLRGIYLNPPEEIIGIKPDSEQYVDSESDTTIYSLKKMVKLLSDCNPNTIELCGLRKQDMFILTEEGRLLLDNADMFLSKKAIYTFGQYAKSQLNRLVNRSGRGKNEIVQNETRSIEKVLNSMNKRYEETNKKDFGVKRVDNEILITMNFKDMPIEKMINMMNEINVVHKDYKKSHRNEKAAAHDKLNKHSMHLIRLYMMGIDILEKHEIRTYRDGSDHVLLMKIRNGDFLEDDMMTPTKEFRELITDYETRFNLAAEKTTLPDKPDYERINKIIMRINRLHLCKDYRAIESITHGEN